MSTCNHPVAVTLKAGERYSWCRCGKSKTNPKCDGSHKGSGISPIRIVLEEDKTVYLCGCKQTGHAPYCDGSHQLFNGGGRDEYFEDNT